LFVIYKSLIMAKNLEVNGYKFTKKLGQGAFGSVF